MRTTEREMSEMMIWCRWRLSKMMAEGLKSANGRESEVDAGKGNVNERLVHLGYDFWPEALAKR